MPRSDPYYFVKRKTPPENPRTPWIEKICIACNEPFFVIHSKAEVHATCSSACSYIKRLRGWEVIICKQCGVEKRMRKCEQAMFCSFACSRKYLSGENHSRWIFMRQRKCMNCERTFPSYARDDSGKTFTVERKYCSNECMAIYQRQFPHKKNLAVGTVSPYGDGYRKVKMPDGKWVPQHHQVMESLLGRPLAVGELVHHRDGIPSNNSENNPMLTDDEEHQQIHYQAERVGLREMWIHPLEGMEL